MSFIENLNPLLIVAIFTGLLSLYFFIAFFAGVKKLQGFTAIRRLFSFLLFAAVTFSLSMLVIGVQGFQALTKEEPVAKILVTPTAEQEFYARMTFVDGKSQVFALNGDELMIEAYILKWKPWVNIFGVHTAYRLDRIRGRYTRINQEQDSQPSVFAINNVAGGLAEWRKKYSALSVLLDVEHGSASFVSAEEPMEYQLFVTTDGLLIRSTDDNS